MTVKSFIVQQVADDVEDAAIEHRHSRPNQLMPDGLSQMTLADTRRTDQQPELPVERSLFHAIVVRALTEISHALNIPLTIRRQTSPELIEIHI